MNNYDVTTCSAGGVYTPPCLSFEQARERAQREADNFRTPRRIWQGLNIVCDVHPREFHEGQAVSFILPETGAELSGNVSELVINQARGSYATVVVAGGGPWFVTGVHKVPLAELKVQP